jgi:two-component system, cell cycle sensor histidine kinase and response regulator CckA
MDRFEKLFTASPIAMFITEVGSGTVLSVNPSFVEVTGQDAKALVGSSIVHLDIWPAGQQSLVAKIAAGDALRDADMQIRRDDGSLRQLLISTERITSGDDPRQMQVGIATDMTELRLLERQFERAQKMEMMGQLVAGVAHDFNNLLTVIAGFADLSLDHKQLPSDIRADIEEILKAARSAASVIRQLLVFARRSITMPQLTDINRVVAQMNLMLGRLIGENIKLNAKLAADLKPALIDPAQLEQVIVNLVVNARDAMSGGGLLTIETENVVLDEEWARRHAGGAAGVFVRLAVTDTGIGMDEEVRRQVFEPFFTTKEADRGSGLGLAMVYRAVKRAGGSIWFDSEVGVGTTFAVYLPAISGQDPPPPTDETPKSMRGTETVAVVEDQPEVRRFVCAALARHGYQLFDAPTARDLIARLSLESAVVDLIICDVVLPQMGGTELARICQALRPQVRVLYMSGYAVVSNDAFEPGTTFIQKPFTARDLLEKVRALLDTPAAG